VRTLLSRLARQITCHPARYLAIAAVAGGAAIAVVSHLEFQSSYLALLPEDAPEVKVIERVRRHSGGTGELVIAVGGPKDQRLPFARRVVKRLEASQHVQWAQVELPMEFFEERALLLLSLEQLRKIDRALASEIARAKAKANPLLVDLDEEESEKKRQRDLAELHQLQAQRQQMRSRLRRSVSTSDGRYLLILVKPRAASSQLGEASSVLAAIKDQVEAARGPHDRMPVRYAGNLVSSLEEHRTISRDLSLASALALGLAILLITCTTRRLGATLVIGGPLVLGVLITLAFATLAIGHLNLVSGFLVAALVGLGIDFGIHLYLRFLDERIQIHDPREAMRRAMGATFGPSLTAAATTSVAFLSLILADFRGFSEYGLIAAVGVMLTLLITFLALPPLALLLGRSHRRQVNQRGRRRLHNTRQLARPLAWAMLACGLGFILLSASNLGKVRFFNNFKQLRESGESAAFEESITRELGGSLAPALIMVDSLQQARRVEQLTAEHASSDKISYLGKVLSLASMVPDRARERSSMLSSIQRHVSTLLEGDLPAEERKQLRELGRLAAARPWSQRQVPDAFSRRLVSNAGDKYFVLLWSSTPLTDDERIQAWARQLDKLTAELAREGIAAQVLDENLVAARVLALIQSDGPRVMVLSAVAVLLILLLDQRRLDRVLLVGGSVALGMVGMLGVMTLFDLQLNLFNVVVLPTVLGIGIDNAVHLQHAYNARGPGKIPLVVATSGRAAMLSSATTAIGFGAAIVAHHVGIQQLGILALIGIGCTFTSSTVLFPAVLRLLEPKAKPQPQPRAAAEETAQDSPSPIAQTGDLPIR
jgi:predicted RND superfamily exporter protein